MTGDARTPDEAVRERRLRELTDDGEIITAEQFRQRSRRSFLGFGALGVAGYVGFNALQNQAESDNIPSLLRWGLERNDDVWSLLERDGARARTFDVEDREDIRVNGTVGLESPLDEDFVVSLRGADGQEYGTVPAGDVRNLDAHDMVWEHKCIEGWANIVHWTGAKMADFVDEYQPDDDWEYISLRTPDEEYYVGIDRYTAFHDQTLVAWALNGEDLTSDHGAPLRLATPFKYGIKQLKRIGIVEFTNERPTDYWFERGYDWHAGF